VSFKTAKEEVLKTASYKAAIGLYNIPVTDVEEELRKEVIHADVDFNDDIPIGEHLLEVRTVPFSGDDSLSAYVPVLVDPNAPQDGADLSFEAEGVDGEGEAFEEKVYLDPIPDPQTGARTVYFNNSESDLAKLRLKVKMFDSGNPWKAEFGPRPITAPDEGTELKRFEDYDVFPTPTSTPTE